MDAKLSVDQVATVMPDGLPEMAACARELALVKPGAPGRLSKKCVRKR